MYLGIQSVLSVYASGRTTAIAISSGAGVSCAVPIYEGHVLPHCYVRQNFGGRDVTGYFAKILIDRGYSFTNSAELEIVRDIKEKVGYTAEDYESELHKADTSNDIDKNYELPDGQVITIGGERFCCSEVLFKTYLFGKNFNHIYFDSKFNFTRLTEYDGIHQMVYKAIMKCDINLRRELYGNIVLDGGNTMFPGFDVRLRKEMICLAPASVEIKIIAAPERNYFAWIGGSIISSVSTFQEMWLSKDEYDESGPGVVHRKCF
eukprot:259705_1